MTIKERLVTFLDYLRIGQNKFETNVGISIGYVNKVKNSIGSEVIEKIVNAYPELNINWLIMEKGSMLLSETENLSENKTNLAKQNKKEERLFSIKEVNTILNKQKEVMTEEFGKIIMEKMTHIIEGQLDLLKIQVKSQSETIQGQKEMINNVLDKINGVEEKTGKIVEMVERKIG